LVPSRYEGRFAIVISAGWDAVDVEVPTTNGADAYGEDVWSRRRGAGVKSSGTTREAMVARKPFTREGTL